MEIGDFNGTTLKAAEISGGSVTIVAANGQSFRIGFQDLPDAAVTVGADGDLADLIGPALTWAEGGIDEGPATNNLGTYTWASATLATALGRVRLRFTVAQTGEDRLVPVFGVSAA